jgi:hypothetical protein
VIDDQGRRVGGSGERGGGGGGGGRIKKLEDREEAMYQQALHEVRAKPSIYQQPSHQSSRQLTSSLVVNQSAGS